MPRKKSSFLSDLVRDARIETAFLGTCIQHVFHETGRVAGERRSRKEERWVRDRFLGQGSYGTVYLEKLETEPSELRAVKEIKKFLIPGQELDYTRELEAIMKFSHQKYQHCFVTSRGWFDLNDSIYIAMDFHELGDLQRHLENPLPEWEAREIAAQVLEGLGFMHENGFIHRDLKPANIMVVTKRPKWWVKIADFGISKRRQQGVTTMFTLQRGTFGFAAPEAIIADDPNATYTFSVDMWSLGAVIYKMLTNSTAFPTLASLLKYSEDVIPFPALNLAEHRVSDDGQDFIMKLMEASPDARLTAVSAEQHPWITKILSITEESESKSFIANEGDVAQEATDISMASRAWSTDNLTVLPATCVKQSNYRPPSVTDQLDETHCTRALTFPADPDYPLLDVIAEALDLHSLDLEPPLLTTQRREDIAICAQGSFKDCPISIPEEENGPIVPVGLKSDDPTVRLAEDGVTELDSAVARIPDIEHRTQSQSCQDEFYTSSSEDEYGEHYTESEAESSQAADIESVFTVPSSNLKNLAGNKTEEIDMKAQIHTGEDGLRPDNDLPEPQGKVVYCDNCEVAFSYFSCPIEFLACGHRMCHSCLIRLICLSLVSPKHMPPRCCEGDAGVIGLQHFSRLLLNPEIDSMILKISSLESGWKCPRGHSPKNGSLLATIGQTPIWKETVNCSGCLTQAWNSKKSKSCTSPVPSEFCLLCSSEIGSGECCDCWTIWSVIENILSWDAGGSRISWIDFALQRAYNTRFKLIGGARIHYQTLEEAIRSPTPKMTDTGASQNVEPSVEDFTHGGNDRTEDEEEEEDDNYDSTQDEDDEDAGQFTEDEISEDDLDDDDHLSPDNYNDSVTRATRYLHLKAESRLHQNQLRYRPPPPCPDIEYPRRVPPYTDQNYAYTFREPTFPARPPPPRNSKNHIPNYPILDCNCPIPKISYTSNGLAVCYSCGGRWKLDLPGQANAAYTAPPYTVRPSSLAAGKTSSSRSRGSPLTFENLRYISPNNNSRRAEIDRLTHQNGSTNSQARIEGASMESIVTWQRNQHLATSSSDLTST